MFSDIILTEECERFKQQIKALHNFNQNYVQLSTSNDCNLCKKYNNKIYSIDKNDRMYPYVYDLPTFLRTGRCPECRVHIGFYTYYPELDDLSGPLSDDELAELDRQRKKK